LKKVAVIALRKAAEGDAFLVVHQHEFDVLDSLPLWITRLFLALLRCSDFATGAGQITYGTLAAMLCPIQPRSGPRHFAPDVQAITKAVRALEARRIVSRDKARSQAGDCLFFAVAPRFTSVRPKAELEGGTRTPPKPRKASNGAGSSPVPPGTRTRNSNPSSTTNSLHSKEGELSTCGQVGGREKAVETLRRLKTEIRVRGAGGTPSTVPPAGG
jgi:hypothetical protein